MRSHRLLEQAALLGLIAAVFYTTPVAPDPQLPVRGALSLVLLAGLAVLVVRQLRHYPDRIGRLIIVFLAVVALLALVCYAMAVHRPEQFTGLATRTDALYFTITTISTVGYGDIHAVGQTARALVTLMIVFDVVFLGALGSAISAGYQRRRSQTAAPTTAVVVQDDERGKAGKDGTDSGGGAGSVRSAGERSGR